MNARLRLSVTSFLVSFLLVCGCVGGARVQGVLEVVPPGTADFALEVYPVPVEARLSDRVYALGSVSVEGEIAGEAATVLLGELFPRRETPARADTRLVIADDSDGAGPGSYRLSVTPGEGGLELRIEAGDAPGLHWALLALRQLSVIRGDERWVRGGEVVDRPGFPLRGSKRPLPWEEDYRANLSYDGAGRGAGGRPVFIPVLSPGGELDAAETGVVAAERFFREHHSRGVRSFAIEFDDTPYGMTEETRDRFGIYPAAVAHYLRECRRRLARIDPGARLYWLPQTYWTHHRLLGPFSGDVGLHGGVPPDIGLVLTGPEIISREIRAEEIGRARRAFGLTREKALIYDNLGREGDHGPLRGRDPELRHEVNAVFGERGEVLNRLTRLDFSWNPVAYDPERSLLLACREIAGPAAAPHLADLILLPDGAPVLTALHHFRETVRRLDPPARAPVRAQGLLGRVWRDRFRPIVDTGSQSQ